jgi:hypothetical protein
MGNADQNQSGSAPILPIDVPTDPAAGDASAWDRWFPPEAAQQGMRTPSGAVPVVSPSASPMGAATSSGSPAPRHTAGQASSGTRPIPARPIPAQPIAIPARPIQARPVGSGAAETTPVSAATPAKKQLTKQLAPTDQVVVALKEPAGGKPDAAEEAADEEDAVDSAARRAPPWLLSTVVHMLLLIIMGLLTIQPSNQGSREIELDVLGDGLGDEPLDASVEIGEPTLEPAPEAPALAHLDVPDIPEPVLAPPTALATAGKVVVGDMPAPKIGYALSGRDATRKGVLLGKYGGDKNTEEAVLRALAWLKRNQRPDGSWSLTGPYEDGSSISENTVAATAMALLAFQGAGHTHQQGEYQAVVQKGWNSLLRMQDSEGLFGNKGVFGQQHFYAHGQATIAICEAYGMTRDSRLLPAAERAVRYCVRTQFPDGGWKYEVPRKESDTSVTGWILMGLQSARMAGIEVPQATFDNISRFLDAVAREGGSKYVYEARDTFIKDPTMTAEALLCRQYLGWKRDDPRLLKGVAYLAEHTIGNSNTDVYYWYYATQVCHHMEGDAWKRWNDAMKRELPASQVRSGAESGSWSPRKDEWGALYGRLYTTCLNTYSLEVYYRHLPIYTKVFEAQE